MERLEDLEVYRLAEDLSNYVWEVVSAWEGFAKRTVGTQLVDATDSIAANIAEGHGRFHYADNRRFCFYARGSYEETRSWLRRATRRKLLQPEQIERIRSLVQPLGPKLNAYINAIGRAKTKIGGASTNAECQMPNS